MLQTEHKNIDYSSKGGGKARPSEKDHLHPGPLGHERVDHNMGVTTKKFRRIGKLTM